MNNKELEQLLNDIQIKTDEYQELINKAIKAGFDVDLSLHHWDKKLNLSISKPILTININK